MAARVAAQLKKEKDVQVEIVKGGIGEFAVLIDGEKIIDTNRLWYPNPSKVVNRVRATLDSIGSRREDG
jgi:hypothetical protein